MIKVGNLPLHVIVVTSWFPGFARPYFSPLLAEFVHRLTARGVRVSIYVPRLPRKNPFESGAVRIHKASGPIGLGKFASELLMTPSAIVHVQRPNTYSSVFIIMARLLRRPTVATIHRAEVLPYHPLPWGLLKRAMLKIIDRAICVSNSTRLLTIESGCPSDRTVVIYNTLNEQRFKPRPKNSARELLGLPRHRAIILYVGDFRREKGCDNLLRAFSGITSPCILLLVGTGGLREKLTELGMQLGISERLLFAGHVSHDSEKLPLYYNAADVFVLPSLTEGHSLALLEALASGVPIVATRVGGNIETIMDGENGLLISPGDVDDLKGALKQLLESPEMCLRLARAAQESYSRRFGEEISLAKTLQLYRQLVHAQS